MAKQHCYRKDVWWLHRSESTTVSETPASPSFPSFLPYLPTLTNISYFFFLWRQCRINWEVGTGDIKWRTIRRLLKTEFASSSLVVDMNIISYSLHCVSLLSPNVTLIKFLFGSSQKFERGWNSFSEHVSSFSHPSFPPPPPPPPSAPYTHIPQEKAGVASLKGTTGSLYIYSKNPYIRTK